MMILGGCVFLLSEVPLLQAAARLSAERQLAEASSLWQTAAADGKLLRQRITILEEVRDQICTT